MLAAAQRVGVASVVVAQMAVQNAVGQVVGDKAADAS